MEKRPPEGVIEVYILSARSLPIMKQSAELDPFCLVEVTNSERRYTTMTVKGHYPAWNESCQMPIHKLAEQLVTVKLFDRRSGEAPQFIGIVVVPAYRIAEGQDGEEGGCYDLRGLGKEQLEGPDGPSKLELNFRHWPVQPQKGHSGMIWCGGGGGLKRAMLYGRLDPYSQCLFGYPDEESASKEEGLVGTLNIRGCKIETARAGDTKPPPTGSGPEPPDEYAFRFKVLTSRRETVEFATESEAARTTWHSVLKASGAPSRPKPRQPPLPPSRPAGATGNETKRAPAAADAQARTPEPAAAEPAAPQPPPPPHASEQAERTEVDSKIKNVTWSAEPVGADKSDDPSEPAERSGPKKSPREDSDTIKLLRSTLKGYVVKCNELQKENTELKGKVQDAETEAEKARAEAKTAQESAKRTSSGEGKESAQLSALQERTDELENEKAALEVIVRGLRAEVEKSNAVVTRLSKELQEVHGALSSQIDQSPPRAAEGPLVQERNVDMSVPAPARAQAPSATAPHPYKPAVNESVHRPAPYFAIGLDTTESNHSLGRRAPDMAMQTPSRSMMSTDMNGSSLRTINLLADISATLGSRKGSVIRQASPDSRRAGATSAITPSVAMGHTRNGAVVGNGGRGREDGHAKLIDEILRQELGDPSTRMVRGAGW